VDRQWSSKLESHLADARRVVMAYGLASAHREELKDDQLLSSLRTEQRSCRLNGSGMNKIARTTSGIHAASTGARHMSKLAIVAVILRCHLAVPA
jgi:hypothetical protein